MNDPQSYLSIRDLTVEYTSEGEVIHAVNHLSLDIRKRATLGLVGETGAGKTTIAKSIMRILPAISSRVTSGEIVLEGKDLLKTPEPEMMKIRGQKISMIFQDPMTALNPVQRIGDQIAEVVYLHSNVSHDAAMKRAEDMLEMVGIPRERAVEYPHQLSGGMKQRVIIAIALACRPELLLADEPTTALDVTIQAQVLDMIRRLKEDLDTSMLLITHDLGVVAEVCDDVAVIYAGQIMESGSLADIFDHPTHPYTKGLFGALPSLKKNVHRLVPIEGMPADPTKIPKGCPFAPRCKAATPACLTEYVSAHEVSAGHFCRCNNR